VIEEIIEVKKLYGYPEISMMAENLLSNPKWIKRFCELIDKHKLKFRWTVAGHANVINDEILRLVKSHGCYRIGIGFENFSQKILDNMNKNVKVEKYVETMRLLLKHELEFTGTMIFGYFGEDYETIEENVRFCNRFSFAPFYFWIQTYPTTVLYEQCISKNLIGDEERYIEMLGDNSEFVINLTEFSCEELSLMRDDLHRRIKVNWKNPYTYLRLAREVDAKCALRRIAINIMRKLQLVFS
jgi:Fe-S oxidoreductase